MEAIKALQIGRELSLADCKTELTASPAWMFEVADRLHAQIVEQFDGSDDG